MKPTRFGPRLRLLGIVLAAILAPAAIFPGMLAGRELPISVETSGLNDLYDVNLPLRAWGGDAIAHGRLPLWYPGSDGGLAIAAIPEAVPYYPFSAGFYALLNPTAATAFSILFHFALAGIGAALLARRLGCAFSGQLLVAVVVSGGLWLPNHMRQLNLLQSGAWVPWAWLFWDRLLGHPGKRNIAGLGLAMGMLALAGHAQMLHHTALMLTVWSILRGAMHARWRRPKALAARAAAITVAAALALAIGAPHLIPTLEVSRWADRQGLIEVPAMPIYLTALFNPLMFGDPVEWVRKHDTFFGPIFWEQALYLGIAPLILAYGALNFGGFSRRRRPVLLALAAFIGAGLVLTYGRSNFSLNRFLLMIPMDGAFRFTQRYLWFVDLALAMLAGLGLSWLERRFKRRDGLWSKRLAAALAPAILIWTVVDLSRAIPAVCPVGDPSAWMTPPASLALIKQAGASNIRFGERIATYALLRTVARAFQIRGGWNDDLRPDAEVHRLFINQHPSLWNWPTVWGNVGLVPEWTARAFSDQHLHGLVETLDWGVDDAAPRIPLEWWTRWTGFLGARWIVSATPLQSERLRPAGGIEGAVFNCNLYENLDWAGPARIVHDLTYVPNDQAAMEDLAAHLGDRARGVVSRERKSPLFAGLQPSALPSPDIETPPSLPAQDRVQAVESPSPEQVNVSCWLASDGTLILDQNFHPRWQISVDGEAPRPAQRVDLAQTAVSLAAGVHRVVFSYPGTLEKLCLLLSIFGLTLIAGMAAWNPAIAARIRGRLKPPDQPRCLARENAIHAKT